MLAYHVYLRKRLLTKAMTSGEVNMMKFALAILDSLANIQGITQQVNVDDTQISITIVPKPESKFKEPSDESNSSGS